MLQRNLIAVWLGIILLSGMFLMGQDTWPPPVECTVAEDCDDGNLCTDDACVDQACVYTNNTDPCDDGEVCTMDDVCTDGVCTGDPLDADGDTYYSEVCGGDDCDDGNPNIYPDAAEICDGVDNQCPGDVGYGDVDEGCSMAQIPAGCFDMGDAFAEGNAEELPVHNVCISAFEMDVHEVTNAEYQACVLAGGCEPPPYTDLTPWGGDPITYYGNPVYDSFPVIYVSWNQATTYCTWAVKRLPTEAEWEYAARGGLAGGRYPWGDTVDCGMAAYDRYWPYLECLGYDGRPDHPHEVTSYAPNGYDLYDMAGNVYEWVNDRYGATYYSSSPVNDPQGPTTGFFRVYRGGSWHHGYPSLRVADRNFGSPTANDFGSGFRCAR